MEWAALEVMCHQNNEFNSRGRKGLAPAQKYWFWVENLLHKEWSAGLWSFSVPVPRYMHYAFTLGSRLSISASVYSTQLALLHVLQ